MQCPKCGADIGEGKLSFRACCDTCLTDLHSCRNCKYYKVGLQNDCMVPGTEQVSDRERNNFCEEFSPLGLFVEKKTATSKRFDDLFK